MGVMIGDIDGDADPDLAVTNFDVETNTLYRNQGNLMFEDVSAVSGFGLPSFNALAFGIVAADFDRDGALDVYVANGHIFDDPARENVTYRQPDQVLAGDGVGGFTLVPCELLDASPTVARGLAAADADNDGDPDLAVQENGGPLRLLLNDAAAGDSWLGVKLRGAGPNTEGIGAVVDVRSTGGAQRRWVVAGDSYQSSSDRRPLFGFGAEKPASLNVLWRAGTRVEFRGLPADRYLVVFESPRRR